MIFLNRLKLVSSPGAIILFSHKTVTVIIYTNHHYLYDLKIFELTSAHPTINTTVTPELSQSNQPGQIKCLHFDYMFCSNQPIFNDGFFVINDE